MAKSSGGAAIVANMLGRHPEIADEALLIACPCDVEAWRRHMLQKTRFDGFRGEIETLSPIDLVSTVSHRVRIVMIAGAKTMLRRPA